MSGPQGYDPTQPWQPQQPGQGEQGTEQQSAWQQPVTPEQPTMQTSGWQQPAYTTPPQYQQPTTAYPPTPQYPQQQPTPSYGQPDQFGQQPGQFGQTGQPDQFGQYGQPGQYGQFGQQPGQYGQPGQFPPYGQPGPEQGKKGNKAVIGSVIGVLAALAVVAFLVSGFWLPGFLVTTKLDIKKAQDGVQQILTDQTNGYGAKNVKDVKCNNDVDPKVKKNDTFECEVSIDGTKRKVTVTFQDDKGTYEVGRPK
ncbi:DUF4333 domain-containing protein [Mycobacterium talmoniae]|uniref:DUF4333 domain-containing protein n=1 Tax=Mycobacterium talmoniae TaxID=1858794 RepID=A0A1S1NK22_9MYCO|nr:DUF4333 domain-containing protein [Mycobacterium talmoniae]OHV01737.1 hypothetical protein BKN37_16545 [Mycobacterium talmoniae]